MAFRDENGRITIDEVAAQSDINTIIQALANLQNAQKAVSTMIATAESSHFSGLAANAMMETTGLLQKNIAALSEELQETIDTINRVVAFYQRKDSEVKDLINGNL